ncbi:MAG TPA: hypothetical protein VIK69_11810 [Methylophilaceae bacterium]
MPEDSRAEALDKLTRAIETNTQAICALAQVVAGAANLLLAQSDDVDPDAPPMVDLSGRPVN